MRLTARQLTALMDIRDHFESFHSAPTFRELGAGMGISRQAARDLVLRLEDAGLIARKIGEQQRAYSITPAGFTYLEDLELPGDPLDADDIRPPLARPELGDLGPLADEGSAPKPPTLHAELERHALAFDGDESRVLVHALEVASGAAAIGHPGKIGGGR